MEFFGILKIEISLQKQMFIFNFQRVKGMYICLRNKDVEDEERSFRPLHCTL